MKYSDLHSLDAISLMEAIEQRCLTLVPNVRARRRLLQVQSDLMRTRGSSSWQRAPIVTFDSWLRTQFVQLIDDGRESRTLLNASQSLLVWQQVIEASSWGNGLLRIRDTASLAMQAARILADWNIHHEQLRGFPTEETQAFLSWRDDVVTMLARRAWITSDHLITRITQAITDGELPAPERLCVLPSNVPTRAQVGLLEVLQQTGTKLTRVTVSTSGTCHHVVRSTTVQDEYAKAADWALHQLQHEGVNRVAIALSSPQNEIVEVRRALKHASWPQSTFSAPKVLSFERDVTSTESHSLSAVEVVNDALALMRLMLGRLPALECSSLLRSPYINGALLESGERSMLDVQLRKTGRRNITLSFLTKLAAGSSPPVPILNGMLSTLAQLKEAAPRTATLADWSVTFGQWFRAIKWASEHSHIDACSRPWQRFADLLPEMGQLSALEGNITASQALNVLTQLASDARIDLDHATDAKIHIISVDDAAIMPFDAIWLVGASDDQWPHSESLNPFVPVSLQRHSGMPYSAPATALQTSHRLLAAVSQNSGRVIASCASTSGDSQIRLSQLFSGWSAARWSWLQTHETKDPWASAIASVELETFEDTQGLPLPAGEPAPGGTALIARQSDCPFQAYARHRLKVDQLESPVDGIDARLAGETVHSILECLWGKLGNSKALEALSDTERAKLVENCVDLSLKKLAVKDDEVAKTAIFGVERERLLTLIHAWLTQELRRETAFEILDLERPTTVRLGPISLRTKADRVDCLETGELVILDYKTSSAVTASAWDDDRLREPQVPIYAVTRTRPVAGLAFGQLNATACAFKGIVEDKNILPIRVPKDAPSFADRMTRWREQLEALAQEAAAGHAAVSPRDASTCRYCPVSAACRIAELNGGVETEAVETVNE